MMSSTVMAPALPTIARALHTNESTTNMTLSIFVLSFGLGSMVLAPMVRLSHPLASPPTSHSVFALSEFRASDGFL